MIIRININSVILIEHKKSYESYNLFIIFFVYIHDEYIRVVHNVL